ncbi:MAG TPA: superoxide dismutase [Caulobacteraceae bacterium]|nr:superoxide dismutase [Caulobacteraceae bacterium]
MFKLPDLPYDYDALEPVISAETMEFHHDKHHGKYVETTNKLLLEAGERPAALESVVKGAETSPEKIKLFDNAAQAWNHAFFWQCMSADGSGPTGELADAIGRSFGEPARLKEEFVREGSGHFGSGWVWLAAQNLDLKIFATHDADDPLTRQGMVPLLVCDLWEHAYYLDHQNDREGFLAGWFDNLANWDFAAEQFQAAQGRRAPWRHPAPA